MRQYEVRLVPDDGWFHPFDRVVRAEPDLDRVAIHNMHLVGDDVGQALYEFRGDVERLRTIMGELQCDAEYQVNQANGRIFNYLLFEPNDTIRELLAVHHDHKVFLDPPQQFTPDGDLLLTYHGTEETFHEAMAAVPDRVTVKLERKTEFRPSHEPFVSTLTEGQQTIVRTAVELGYYDIPRKTTYEEIGEELGVTAATVGEHLRKAEAKLVQQNVSGRSGGPKWEVC